MRSIISYGLFIVLICSILTRLSKAEQDDYDPDNYPDSDYPEYPDYDTDDVSQITGGDSFETGTKISESEGNENKAVLVNATEEKTVMKIDGIQENITEIIGTEISESDVDKTVVLNAIGEDTTPKVDAVLDNTESVRHVISGDMEIHEQDTCSRCTCDDQLQFIDCSNRSLIGIPKNLPNTSISINLSNNRIVEINEIDFSNLTELRKLMLTNNKIENINQNAFKSLYRLDFVELSSNNISKIDPDLFLDSQGLSQLDLNNNPIVFEANKPFLNLTNLVILNLVGCNISQLYNETFMNLTGLQSLNLANNSLSEDINVDAFHPLTDLLKLKIPHVSRTATYGLCEKISVIDVISFDNYNISCYELISGSSYDESTITHGPPTTAETTTAMRSTRMQEITTTTTTTESVILTTSPNHNVSTITEISLRTGDTESISTINALNTTDVDSKKLEISTQSIKTILIASFVVAVVGLIIGLICRKDLFGVKTKLCRTQRPEPVTIPEQVPLNKV